MECSKYLSSFLLMRGYGKTRRRIRGLERACSEPTRMSIYKIQRQQGENCQLWYRLLSHVLKEIVPAIAMPRSPDKPNENWEPKDTDDRNGRRNCRSEERRVG